MNATFEYMLKKYSITSKDMLNALRQLKIEQEMKSLLAKLKLNNFKTYIVSDANTLFMKTILEANNLLDLFSKEQIVSNPVDLSLTENSGFFNIIPYNPMRNRNRTNVNFAFKIAISREFARVKWSKR
jgi:2-hydroxy-3-keto-5-methylthiopentenyl-1-phosphate phosphatase